jgi:hypothetical protein
VKTTGYNQDVTVVITFRRTVMVYMGGMLPAPPWARWYGRRKSMSESTATRHESWLLSREEIGEKVDELAEWVWSLDRQPNVSNLLEGA